MSDSTNLPYEMIEAVLGTSSPGTGVGANGGSISSPLSGSLGVSEIRYSRGGSVGTPGVFSHQRPQSSLTHSASRYIGGVFDDDDDNDDDDNDVGLAASQHQASSYSQQLYAQSQSLSGFNVDRTVEQVIECMGRLNA
jgi:hypothetical protein